ncbi:hypothetical protein Ancab_015201 [Ancistrocladus abbreviatus]
MGSAREKKSLTKGSGSSSSSPLPATIGARNLRKAHLGGVIFGCSNSTVEECLIKQLFGLPHQHFLYVKNIDPGLPLFLFNYSDRSLHGIFEAASTGQMYIDSYGWTTDGSERTPYPAQVQIRVRLHCEPLLENQFAPIIADNYYTRDRFWFELDHAQTDMLISLFSSKVVAAGSFLANATKCRVKSWSLPSSKRRDLDEEIKPQEPRMASTHPNQSNGESSAKLAVNCGKSIYLPVSHVEEAAVQGTYMKDDKTQTAEMVRGENNEECSFLSSDFQSIVSELMLEIQELKGFKNDQIQKMDQLQQKLVESELEIQQLKERCTRLESISNHSEACTELAIIESLDKQQFGIEDIIFLVGGYDGESWLSSLDLYSPSRDIIKLKRPLLTVRSYTAVANLNGHLYVVGGGDGEVWYDTVESYNPTDDEWTSHPSLKERKGGLAAATLSNKIFAVGGGNGLKCSSHVEMFDLDFGKWISSRSMLEKISNSRFKHMPTSGNCSTVCSSLRMITKYRRYSLLSHFFI